MIESRSRGRAVASTVDGSSGLVVPMCSSTIAPGARAFVTRSTTMAVLAPPLVSLHPALSTVQPTDT
ncbi:hypothetical protein BEH93_23390 [Streptomyces sp. 2R]|nr:hypothetical protein BEH93_23390 [Streptomyces sp. 2R]